ncbi:MAG: PAS domain S-box protein [Acidimicrobiales bacterium]|nr:PAS domain S-box protein [Acidimicrobiales bacterium]
MPSEVAWAMVESSPDGMLLVDEDGVLVRINQQVESLFGLSRDELIGSPVERLLPERFRDRHTSHRHHYRSAPEPRAMGAELNLWARRSDGTEFPVEVSLSPVTTPEGQCVVATVRDVTARHEAEAEFHAVLHTVDSARDGVFMFDPDNLRFTYVNKGAIRQMGYSEDELLELTPVDIKPEFDDRSFRELLKPLVDGEADSHTFTTVHRRKDRRDVPVEVVLGYPEPADNGRPRRMVALVRDITERVEAARAREASEAAFRAAFEGAPVGMAIADFSDPSHRQITRANTALCELLGYDTNELLALGFAELTHPDDTVSSQEWAHRAQRGEIPRFALEKRYVHADGHEIWVWVHAAVLGDGTANTMLIHVVDLTEARRARRDESRLRVLQDRERLAEDLHDLIIQRLFAAGMGVQSLQGHLDDPVARDRLQRTVDELDRAITDLRSAIFRLHTPGTTAVRDEIESTVDSLVSSLGFRPRLTISGDPEKIPGMVVEQLLPTISEGLTNVARHARATAAAIELRVGDDIDLTITDDGIGVDPCAAEGHGLKNLRSRAERVGGTSGIKPAVSGGSVLTWHAKGRS